MNSPLMNTKQYRVLDLVFAMDEEGNPYQIQSPDTESDCSEQRKQTRAEKEG